jgi:hypothetical protein
MISNLRNYTKLKTQVEALKRERERARGARDELMRRLEEEFGSKTLRAARKLVRQAKRDWEAADKAFTKALADFEEEWQDVLND